MSSLIAAKANAQETPTKADDVTPITRTYQKSLYALLYESNTPNVSERAQAVAELMQEAKKQGLSELEEEVRQKVQAILRVAELEQGILGAKKAKRDTIAKELATKWMEDPNYYVREHAKRILDDAFENNRAEDPRYQPPDIRAYTEIITEAKPAGSVAEWEQSVELGKLTELIKEQVRKMGSPKFKERMAATRELSFAVVQLQNYVNPLPEEIQNQLVPRDPKTGEVLEIEDLEVRSRMARVLKTIDEAPLQESRLPPLSATAEQVLSEIRNQFGVHIQFADPLNHYENVEISFENNSYTQVLNQLCQTTGTYPVCGGHSRKIILVSKEAASVDLYPLHGMLAVHHRKDLAENADDLELFTDPRMALVSMISAESSGLCTKETTAQLLPKTPETWQVNHSGAKRPTHSATMKPGDEKQQNITIHAWLGSKPVTNHVKRGEFADDGTLHDYRFLTRQLENGQWEAGLHMGIHEHLTWPATTHDEDAITYANAERTHVTFFDKDGREIPGQMQAFEINQRRGSLKYTLSEEPVSATVTTFSQLQETSMALPLSGAKAEHKVLRARID